jgi:hypothetical protein
MLVVEKVEKPATEIGRRFFFRFLFKAALK